MNHFCKPWKIRRSKDTEGSIFRSLVAGVVRTLVLIIFRCGGEKTGVSVIIA